MDTIRFRLDLFKIWVAGMTVPGELARVLVPLGTTTVFVDATNVITTGGVDAVEALLKAPGLRINR